MDRSGAMPEVLPIPATEVWAQFEDICAASEIPEKPRDLLRFLLDRAVNNLKPERLSAKDLVELHYRGEASAGSVRTEILRLRGALANYYESHGRSAPFIIELPEGSRGYYASYRRSPAYSAPSEEIPVSPVDSNPDVAHDPFSAFPVLSKRYKYLALPSLAILAGLLFLFRVTLVKAPAVRLRVQSFDGKPVIGANVVFPAMPGKIRSTSSDGSVIIPVPKGSPDITPGSVIKFDVAYKDWVVYDPLGGSVALPKDFNIVLHVGPRGNADALQQWGERIVAMALLQEDKALQPLEQQQPKLTGFIRQVASEYGYSIEQVQDVVQRWADEVEKKRHNGQASIRELAEAAYARRELETAASLFKEAAAVDLNRVEETRGRIAALEQMEQERLRRYLDNMIGGADSRRSQFQYREARATLEEAARQVDRVRARPFWIEMTRRLATAEREEGVFGQGSASATALAAAIRHYQTLVEELTRPSDGHDLAVTNINFCEALTQQAQRSRRIGSDEKAMGLYAQATKACRAAVEEASPGNDRLVLAAAQHQLGFILFRRGEIEGDTDTSLKLFGQAEEAFTAALKVRITNRARVPQDYAMSRSSLGAVLIRQAQYGKASEAPARLKRAVDAFQDALGDWIKASQPQYWAMTQDNLGNALRVEAQSAEPAEASRLLGMAIAAHHEALKVRTETALPQDFAATEDNLGLALRAQAELRTGNEATLLLDEAANAHRAALRVYTKDSLPQDYALTSTNLAMTQMVRKDWPGAIRSVQQTLSVYPEHIGSWQRLELIYREHLFLFAKAYEMGQHISSLDKDHSPDVQIDFAKNELTTGRFKSCIERINTLAHLDVQTAIEREVVRFGCQYALGERDLGKSAETLVSMAPKLRKPEDASVVGVKHFILINSAFAKTRKWWLTLFDEFEVGDGTRLANAVQEILHESANNVRNE